VTVARPPEAGLAAAVSATYVAFVGAGFGFASWASRIPQVRDHLHLNPATLGLVLLSLAAGSLVALPLSGPFVSRFGSRRVLISMALLMGAALLVVSAGYVAGLAVLVVGLFFFGVAAGTWDVAMNVHGAVVERLMGRSVMPRFHAGFSLGTVAGALVGAAMVGLGVPVTLHLAVVAVVVGVFVAARGRRFVDDLPGGRGAEDTADRRPPFASWLEPRTLLIGVFVFAFAFAEGTGNDWISVAMIDSYGTRAAVGTLGFAAFLTAMTVGRWFGPRILDRWGRVRVVRTLCVVALVGLVVFVVGRAATPIGFVGVTLWGLGTSLGFPVGMSAGADDPRTAPARVSVISSIGYFAFLAGPPFIGFLGNRVGVLTALSAVALVLALAAAVAGEVRPLRVPTD